MKNFILGVVMLIAAAPSAMAVRAVCVGGPRGPSYAFSNIGLANQCAQYVASYGKDCSKFVRVGTCRTRYYYVDSTAPVSCACQPGFFIGEWTPYFESNDMLEEDME